MHPNVNEFLVNSVFDDPGGNHGPHVEARKFFVHHVLLCNAVEEPVRIKLPLCRQTVAVPVVKRIDKRLRQISYKLDSVWPIQVFGIGTRPSWTKHIKVGCKGYEPTINIDFDAWRKDDPFEFTAIRRNLSVGPSPTRPANAEMTGIKCFEGYDLPLYMFVINECTGVSDPFLQTRRDSTSIERVSDFLTSYSLAESDSDWWTLRIVSTRTQIGSVRTPTTPANESKNSLQRELSLTKSLASLVLVDKI